MAVATEHRTDPASGVGLWQHERVHQLAVRCADRPGPADLGRVLDAWLDGDHDHADVLETALPSRDVSAVAALVQRHFIPSGVLAVRRSGRSTSSPAGVRAARIDDVDAMVRLSEQLHTYEEQFGVVPHRPDANAVRRSTLTSHLRDHPEWAWLAEDAHGVVGMCVVEPPEVAGWVSGATTATPAAYLSELIVDDAYRATGVGRALADAAHRALDTGPASQPPCCTTAWSTRSRSRSGAVRATGPC